MQTHHIYYLLPEEEKKTGTETIKKINKNVKKNEDAKKTAPTDETEELSCQIGEYTITAVTLDASGLALEKLPGGNKEREGQQSDGIVSRQKKISGRNSKRFRKLFGRNFRLIEKLFAKNRVREKMFRRFHLYDCVKGKDIVVVSEKLQKVLPRHLWYDNMADDFPKGLYEAFAVESLADIINHADNTEHSYMTNQKDGAEYTAIINDTGNREDSDAANHIGCDTTDGAQIQSQNRTIFNLAVILPQDGVTQELLEEILDYSGEMNELIFYSFDEDEKEWLENKLDDFLEETGVAGMCYQIVDDSWENPFQKSDGMGKTGESTILMDFAGRPIKELWGICCYIDAGGKKTQKEIRRLAGRKTHVKALRSCLDSALSLRYNNLA